MSWEASFACAAKERAVTRGEFDLTGNEVGKTITKKKKESIKHGARVSSEERLIRT